MKRISLLLVVLVLVTIGHAQTPRPADPQSEPIAITNATIHTGKGEVIENGIVTFDAGQITGVGTSIATDGHKIIDAAGDHVYPGLIMPSIRLGLEDIAAVRPTRDFQEVGSITPNVRSQIAFNPESELLPTYRNSGILLSQTAPEGGLITGTSSIMMLDAWNWEDATYVQDDAVHAAWPSKTFGPRWWMGETERRPNRNYDRQVTQILELIADAKAYARANSGPVNLKLEAMRNVSEGSAALFVEVNRAREMVDAITKLKAAGIDQLVVVGARDAYYVRELLKEFDIPVILDNIHRRPSREEEPVDFPFELPGLLTAADIKVGLRHAGMLSRGRNLAYYAGTAAAHGMDKEDALKLITSNTAEILGIDARTGSIETGKEANILLVDGDLLDMRSSTVKKAFIQGRDVALEGKQEVLYQRFKEKYSE